MGAKQGGGWFRVGEPLDDRRSRLLMAGSFLLPVLIWCFVSYASFLWKVDYRITLTAIADDKEAFGATYLEGDTMEEGFFRRFQDAIRSDNARIAEARAGGGDFGMSPRAARSVNKKILRDFEPVLVANELFDPRLKDELETKEYYQSLYSTVYKTWGELAGGSREMKAGTLTGENLGIVRKNWEMLSGVSPVYDSTNLFSEPILKLIPEGERQIGRPSYLPAPHEVAEKAWEDFRGESELGDLAIGKKYGESLRIVFFGFLAACLIGVPVALLAGTFSFFSRLIEPFTDFFRYMPAPAFSTVLVAVFGLAQAPKIGLVVMGTLPHLILMVANTTRMVDRSLLDAAQTLGAQKGVLVRRVVIPAILPNLYNDLRILLGWAWTWLVIAELVGMKSGLTEIIDMQGRRFQFDHVYPVIFLIGITGFMTDQVLAGLRGVLFPWTETGKVGLVGRLCEIPGRVVGWLLSDRLEPELAKGGAQG